MSFSDEFGLLKTWKKLSLTFSSSAFSFVQSELSFRDSEGSTISFSVGDKGMFIIDFSRVQNVALITKNDYLSEFTNKLAPQGSLPALVGACLRITLVDATAYLLEERE